MFKLLSVKKEEIFCSVEGCISDCVLCHSFTRNPGRFIAKVGIEIINEFPPFRPASKSITGAHITMYDMNNYLTCFPSS